MKQLTINITESNYDTFKIIADRHNISIENAIEDYLLINKDIPEFKISKTDKYFMTIMLNVISELELLKDEVYSSMINVENKKNQYKTIHRYIDFAQSILEIINNNYDKCEINKISKNKELDNILYFDIISQLHKHIANNHWELVKFLEILAKNFKNINKITVT